MEFSEEQWARLETVFDQPRVALQRTIDALDEVDRSGPTTLRNREGWPISLGQALLLAADNGYQKLLSTKVDPIGVTVSTVWIGWAYGPELFETAVFRGDADGPLRITRYGSEEDARAGHRQIVEEWSAHGRTCPECGALALPQRKFNSGNPATIWMLTCNCEERVDDEFIDRLARRRASADDPN